MCKNHLLSKNRLARDVLQDIFGDTVRSIDQKSFQVVGAHSAVVRQIQLLAW